MPNIYVQKKNKNGICRQTVIKLPKNKFNEIPFSSSRVAVFGQTDKATVTEAFLQLSVVITLKMAIKPTAVIIEKYLF
jgi:hypothetical protein